MAEQNKETFQQLKKLAFHLQKIVQTMRDQYRALSFFAYVAVLYLIVISILLMFSSRIARESDTAIYAFMLMLIVDIAAIINYVQLRKQGILFRQKYQEGRKILQTMADKAEWSRYKKRLIYRGNDESIAAVDDFFSTSGRIWSPCRSEKRYFFTLMLIFPLYILSSFIVFIIKIIWWI